MRRTVLSAMALASTAVLAGAVPAFADDATPSAVPSTRPTAEAPAEAPSDAPAPAESAEPTQAPAAPGQVAVVPKGAPDTGVAPVSAESGTDGALIGAGAAALAVGGAAFVVVRRRRATGA
ncbi:sortase-dependent protein [Streptomyces sp. NPDC060366]|uniref:sortase-dependent protein n=1 Tax=Streptomyces sp. NPDC060366 TaxID=3347105 RepID=UPI00364B04D1